MRSVLLGVALLSSVVSSAQPRATLTSHPIDGGRAVILASLLDRLKLAGNGKHTHELRCATDNPSRACTRGPAFELKAARIACEESHVALGLFSCEVTAEGSAKTQSLSGPSAYELMSVLEWANIPVEGAAGHSMVLAVAVKCSIDPARLLEKAGGGARCVAFSDEGSPPPGRPSL